MYHTPDLNPEYVALNWEFGMTVDLLQAELAKMPGDAKVIISVKPDPDNYYNSRPLRVIFSEEPHGPQGYQADI
jgi:hypothetical protein